MQKSKLITLLKTFSEVEFKEFEKFISATYFNKGRNYLPLYKALKPFHPGFDNPKFTEENIFKKIYPKQKYDNKKLSTFRSMISRMNEMTEKFIVYNKFESGKLSYYFNSCLTEEYIHNNQYEFALKSGLYNSEEIDDEENKENFFYKRLHANILLSAVYMYQSKYKDKIVYPLKNSILYLYGYIFELLSWFHNEYRINIRNRNLTINGDELVMHFIKTFDIALFDKECETDKYETKNKILIYYYYLYSFIEENENDSLLNAIDIYIKIFNNISRLDKNNFYTILLNRCIGKKTASKLYYEKGNELIDFVWSRGITSESASIDISPEKYLAVFHFKFQSLDGIGLSSFVSNYCDKISTKYSEVVKNYSLYCILFKEQQYDKCLKNLSKKPIEDLFSLKTYRYQLKLCCLYELKYYESVFSEVDSFEHFLRKNKFISETIKAGCMKFLNAIKILAKLQTREFVIKKLQGKEILDSTQNLVWGFWFKEKLNELHAKI